MVEFAQRSAMPTRRTDMIWTVLVAAQDLRDAETEAVARRALDALLDKREPRSSDLRVIASYFGV